MAGTEQQHKGTSFLAIVAGLRGLPDVRARLPQHLHVYLEEPIIASGWYPEADYYALLDKLVELIDPAVFNGNDPWEAFGRVGASRDLAGHQEHVPEEQRTRVAGIYRRLFRQDIEAHHVFMHCAMLWDLYHDSGNVRYLHDPADGPVVIGEIRDFWLPHEGFLRLNLGFTLGFLHESGFEARGGDVDFGGNAPGRTHRMTFRLKEAPGVLESLAMLSQRAAE